MENQILAEHVIIISEWDFERKIQIVITQNQVFIYVNRQLVAVKPIVEFFQAVMKTI